MAEADAEIGPRPLADPLADGPLLVSEPGKLRLLPHLLGAAEHQHQVIGGKRGDVLAAVQRDGVGAHIHRRQELADAPGAVIVEMLEKKGAPAHRVTAPAAGRARWRGTGAPRWGRNC